MKTILKVIGLLVLLLVVTLKSQAQFVLAPLPYAYDALEPYIDAQTMEIHYTKHHVGYTNNLNKAILDYPDAPKNINQLMSNISKYNVAVRNNAGGFYNHTLFWNNLAPASGQKPDEFLANAINEDFGSFDAFQAELNKAAATRFGSGWAWLIVNADKKLQITSTPNQDNTLMDDAPVKGTPVIAIDVWEHAYYLKYQNKRGDYLNAIWNVLNWKEINKRHKLAKRSNGYAMGNWPELAIFHTVMNATFHPSEEGNVAPIKAQIKDFVKKAEALTKNKMPEIFATPEIKAAAANMVSATKAFEKGFKKMSDDQIVKELDNLHDLFHALTNACRLH